MVQICKDKDKKLLKWKVVLYERQTLFSRLKKKKKIGTLNLFGFLGQNFKLLIIKSVVCLFQ